MKPPTISLIFCLFLTTISTACMQRRINSKTMNFHKNKIVAHRGAWKKLGLPENSIASLRHSIDLNCVGTEFDVRMTKDEVLIVNHDPEFNHMSIENHTYEELNQFKLSNGESLPELIDFLKAGVHQNLGTQLVLEIKPAEKGPEHGKYIAGKVYRLIQKLKLSAYVTYISFDLGMLQMLESLAPSVITQYLEGDKSPTELKKLGINGLDYHFDIFKNHPSWIEEAKSLGLILNVWTVNNVTDMNFFIRSGFDYITTNEPELLADQIQSKQ